MNLQQLNELDINDIARWAQGRSGYLHLPLLLCWGDRYYYYGLSP